MHQKSWSYAICSWDMLSDGCNCYFSIWAIFCPFTSVTAQKMKMSQQMKKQQEISSFYTCAPKIIIICYTVSEIWCVMDVIVIFHFGLFFALLPPNLPKTWEYHKNEKNASRYHHFAQVYQKSWSYAITVPEIWCVTYVIVIFHFGLFFALLTP